MKIGPEGLSWSIRPGRAISLIVYAYGVCCWLLTESEIAPYSFSHVPTYYAQLDKVRRKS